MASFHLCRGTTLGRRFAKTTKRRSTASQGGVVPGQPTPVVYVAGKPFRFSETVHYAPRHPGGGKKHRTPRGYTKNTEPTYTTSRDKTKYKRASEQQRDAAMPPTSPGYLVSRLTPGWRSGRIPAGRRNRRRKRSPPAPRDPLPAKEPSAPLGEGGEGHHDGTCKTAGEGGGGGSRPATIHPRHSGNEGFRPGHTSRVFVCHVTSRHMR